MNDAVLSLDPPSSATPDWIGELRQQAELLDGIEVAMCGFDLQDRAVAWNRTFLRVFPEHDGHVFQGEHYSANLRRFYAQRLQGAELAELERLVGDDVARHQTQSQPFQFEHRGARLQVSSLLLPGRGRVRVWRPLDPSPADVVTAAELGSPPGRNLLESVPEALLVCRQDGRVVWANCAFCALFGLPELQHVAGSTIEALYARAWQLARAGDDPIPERAVATLRQNLRLPGTPFELPLPAGGCCRVLARPTGDGSVFYALMDISALKRYQADLQLTLDNAGRGIVRYDAGGRVRLFNPQVVELLELPQGLLAEGAAVEDIMRFQQQRGDPGGEAGLPRTGAPARGLFKAGHYLRRTAAGRVLEVSTRPLPDGDTVRTYTDVTDYVQAQGELGEKSRALQITLDSMGQGISAIDSGGRVVFWNRRYQELLNLPDHVLAGNPTMDTVVRFQIERGDFGPGFRFVEAIARGYVAVGDKTAPLRGPETYMRKTPNGRTLQITTRPLPDGGVVRTFADITDYVRSEEALATKQAQLGALVRNLPDRVWLKDRDGVFLLSNPAHQRLHGLDEGHIIGRTGSEVFGAQVGSLQQATDREAMESDQPVTFDDQDFGPDGEQRYAQVVKVAMRDDAGRCVGVLGIAHDITARKRQEAALIRAKEQALEASGAKSRFLSSMSHEIRTPMNAILGMLTLLRGSALSARQQDYAGKAEGAAVSLLGLLNDVLDFSKIEAGKMNLDRRPFSLEAVLSDLSVILSSNLGERDLEVLYDLDPRVPDALVGDDMRLRQILINLGGNAVKFTEQGEVVVRTRLVERGALHAGVEFSVQDSGIGITLEQQERLFTDYAQASGETARHFGGTGLGLGICRRLTELMDSRLQLESTPGQGSRFWFVLRLPLAPPPQAPAVPVVPARVLIVDDNRLARDTLAGLCHAAGWQADTAPDGEQAVARV
ncbi:MAG: hybrid sensor histidine kinase/response regulator, partial [Ramlibacter sp.]|uniref:PAS-domain containing protein n=1 Tax=Ramlibacter sp. TaxID=1917967 RepID=UPI00262AAC7C